MRNKNQDRLVYRTETMTARINARREDNVRAMHQVANAPLKGDVVK